MRQDPFAEEDADGLGAQRGIAVALAIVGGVVVAILLVVAAGWRA